MARSWITEPSCSSLSTGCAPALAEVLPKDSSGVSAQGSGMSRSVCAAGGFALLVLLLCAPAFAANALKPSAYLEYAIPLGDIYNGVTTDDGEPLAGSYSAKARVFYGRFAASFRFYRDASWSQASTTAPAGGPGTVISYPDAMIVVPQFIAVDSASEVRLEYQPGRTPAYFGLAYSNQSNNYDFPRLTALGFGVEVMPNPKHLLSPYGSFFFFPNQTGTYPLANPNNPASGSVASAFHANELELGASIAFPKTPLSLVVGYYQNTNIQQYAHSHPIGNFNFVRDGPFVGLGLRTR
jgi:hypothetical protein